MMVGERRPSERCYDDDLGANCFFSGRVNEMIFSTDGRYLIVASRRPDIELWDVETRQLVGHFEGHIANWVDGVAVSPNGINIATFNSRTASVYMWNLETRQLLWNAKSGIGGTSQVKFSPDGQHLYVANYTRVLGRYGSNPWEGWDDKVRVWNVKSGQLVDFFDAKFRSRLQTIVLSPDGKTAILEYHEVVVIWDIEKKSPLNVWSDYFSLWFPPVWLSPDGKIVVSVSSGYIKTWDVASQQMRLLIPADDGYQFRGLAISPDSKKICCLPGSVG